MDHERALQERAVDWAAELVVEEDEHPERPFLASLRKCADGSVLVCGRGRSRGEALEDHSHQLGQTDEIGIP